MTDIVQVGETMPVIAEALAVGESSVSVTWAEGPRVGRREIVDLAPLIFGAKFYRPLRDAPDLFRTVRPIRGGTALGWGNGEDEAELDMASTSVERLAEESMTPAEFSTFLDRHKLTLDAAAAQLGISRRLVAYYAKSREVPRYIALACAYLDRRAEEAQGRKAA